MTKSFLFLLRTVSLRFCLRSIHLHRVAFPFLLHANRGSTLAITCIYLCVQVLRKEKEKEGDEEMI
jgi:hypothetical protein